MAVTNLNDITVANLMTAIELPRETWVERLNAFTTAHEGWIVTLGVVSSELGAQPEITNLPLIGISADRVSDDGTVAVSVARSAAEHFTHVLDGVTRIYVQPTHNGATAALLIESGDGTKTIIQLRARPGRTSDMRVRH